jgi:hypothetical protein
METSIWKTEMGGTFTMSAGRLEECDNTSSQFVQLFDL